MPVKTFDLFVVRYLLGAVASALAAVAVMNHLDGPAWRTGSPCYLATLTGCGLSCQSAGFMCTPLAGGQYVPTAAPMNAADCFNDQSR